MNKTLKIILILVALVGAFVAYQYFFAGSDSSTATNSVGLSRQDFTAGGTVAVVTSGNAEFLAILRSIETLTLDDTIFASPAFISLGDFSIDIASQPLGRNNPFLPIDPSEVFIPEGDFGTTTSSL